MDFYWMDKSFRNPIGQNTYGEILIYDVNYAQQTNSVKELLKK